MINEANKKCWTMTASSPSLPNKVAINMDSKNRHWATIDGKGIRYSHSYSILDARVIKLENDYTDIILLLRNPWGKDTRGS